MWNRNEVFTSKTKILIPGVQKPSAAFFTDLPSLQAVAFMMHSLLYRFASEPQTGLNSAGQSRSSRQTQMGPFLPSKRHFSHVSHFVLSQRSINVFALKEINE